MSERELKRAFEEKYEQAEEAMRQGRIRLPQRNLLEIVQALIKMEGDLANNLGKPGENIQRDKAHIMRELEEEKK